MSSRTGAALPPVVTLLGLLNLLDCTPSRIAERWRRSDGRASLAAPVGLAEDGVLAFDLVGDGPHGLIGGTTGSGKSELLRSIVASLAATASPEHLTFMLVDYKGGSAFDLCAELPHTVGMVTDLDEHLGQRALTCLEAELHYRERVLRAAGAQDLPAYLALRAERPDLEAMPRLVVVIDEFATMASELPDFIDALVGVAQRGRSLGVHMILATQRPSGAVNDNIRANTNLRVALRVQDKADSNDVLDSPAAAALVRHQPGRGLVRLGPGELVEFQSALVTAASPATGGPRIDVTPFLLHQTGGVRAVGDDDGPSDLSRLVAAATAAFEAAGLPPPRRPWPAPLPERLTLSELGDADGGPWAAVFALADEPERQRQRPWTWRLADGHLLVVGVPGSGTTTALASVGVSLARRNDPDDLHLYALDFGTKALSPLGELPHTGAVIGPNERERQERLVRWLRAELDRRRDWLADNGLAAVHPGSDGHHPPLPAIVVLIDNYGGFMSAFDDIAGTKVVDAFTRVVADGPSVGILVAASADRPGGLPMAVATLIPNKIAMRLADPFDYASYGMKPKEVPDLPAGRGIDADSGIHLQVALPSARGIAVEDLGGRARPAARHRPPMAVLARVAAGAGVGVTAVCPRRSPLRDCGDVGQLVTDLEQLPPVLDALLEAASAHLLLVDDAELLDDAGGVLSRLLGSLVPHLHVVAAGRADAVRAAYGHWTQQVRRSRKGVLVKPHLEVDGDLLQTMLPRHGPRRFPAGRGYLVDEGDLELVQVASCGKGTG